MKRLITCAALLLLAAVVFVVAWERTAQAQEEITFVVVDPVTGFDAQRQQLLERTKAKIELMSDEEVQQALESTDAEIRKMQAKQQLDQTAESLRSIMEEFEGTESATAAKRMLDAMQPPREYRPL